MTSLSGQLRSGFQQQYGDDFRSNEVFVFKDGGITTTNDAGLSKVSVWNGSMMAGHSITASPRIAVGKGSAVIGRFVTRQVDVIARIEVLGADGQVETIEGTTIHPI